MTLHLKDLSSVDVENSSGHVTLSDHHKTFYASFGKRIFDLIFVVLATPIIVPVTLALAIYIALSGAKPFYRQARVGRDGKMFYLLKLRTMVHNADELLEKHLAENPLAREEWDANQKLKQDPRIIRGGKFLRSASLDELPQFWNVFVGDMSVVGPRPMMPEQQTLYPGKAYYRMRPGITGLWQISDRNKSTFVSRANFDSRYWNMCSLKTDISVIASTLTVVLRCTGY